MSNELDRVTELTIQWEQTRDRKVMEQLIALKFRLFETHGIEAVEEAFKKGWRDALRLRKPPPFLL